MGTKIGKSQTKPKSVGGPEAVTVEACVMGQRELAKKKKEDMEKKSEEEEERDKKASCEAGAKEAPGKKAFSLPMDDDSDDWMLHDDVGTMIEDEEDESEKTKVSPEIVEKVVEGDAKKVAFSLPMDDNSDDWMLDDDVGAMIDDEDEEDGSSSNTAREEISGKEEKSGKEEEKRIPDLAEKKSFALPLDDASDDWMLDDDLGTMIEDEEEEAENEQKKKEPSSSKVETEKVTEKKSFSLPLDDASDDWMLDDDLG